MKKLILAAMLDKFWARVDKRGDDECWGWTGSKRTDGRGKLYHKVNGQWTSFYAYRISYMIHHAMDEIPQGLVICHHCDKVKNQPPDLTAGEF